MFWSSSGFVCASGSSGLHPAALSCKNDDISLSNVITVQIFIFNDGHVLQNFSLSASPLLTVINEFDQVTTCYLLHDVVQKGPVVIWFLSLQTRH